MSLELMWGIIFTIGLVAGFAIGLVVTRNKTAHGTLKIDHSNPEKDFWSFEIDDKVLDDIDKKKRIELEIVHTSEVSQE